MVQGAFVDFLTSGWAAAFLLLLAGIFRDALKNALQKVVNGVGNFVYQRLAGSRLLRRRALKKYRGQLLEATGKIRVPFRLNRPLNLDSIYVALRVAAKGVEKPRDAWDVVDEHSRVMVTGPPGAGKSMLVRHLAASCADRGRSSDRYLPVLLELHRLVRRAEGGEAIEDYLVDAFARYGFPRAGKFVHTAIEKNWLLLLLDGLDEVPATERNVVVGRVRDFLERTRSCPVVITCRSAVYHGEFDAVCDQQVELEPFEDQQIQTFLASWTDPMPAGKSPAQLMAALREQPQLLLAARNPLLLTLITHLYSDNPTYALPRSRAEFYGQAAKTLLVQWQDHLRQNQFDGAEKRTILSGLALRMQEIVAEADQDRRTISREDALERTRELMPKLGLESSQVTEIVREIVERSGLLLSIDGGTRYSFAHLTFQEYFAAEALLNRSENLLEQFRNDPDTWREVVILWCGLVADSTAMIEQVQRIDADVALACVAEARSVDPAVADRILDPVIRSVISGEASEGRQKSLGGVAADVRSRGNRVLSTLVDALSKVESKSGLVSIATALSASNRTEAAAAIVSRLDEGEEELEACVVRMGDLAVPELREAARFGTRRTLCAALASIGTPDAGAALLGPLLGNPSLTKSAGWGIAKVVGNPLVAKRLSSEPMQRASQLDSQLDWIWKPFAPSGDSVLPQIVGYAAEQIEATRSPADAIADPDPRISAALCAGDDNPLRQPMLPNTTGRRFVSKANEILKKHKLRFDQQGSLFMLTNEQWRVAEQLIGLGRRSPSLGDYGSALLAVLEALRDEEAPATRRRESVAPDHKRDNPLARKLQPLFGYLPQGTEPGFVWPRLLESMPSQLRLAFLSRIGGWGSVNRENWKAVRTSTPFRFQTSGWYAAVLAIVFAISLLALWGGSSIVASGAGSVESLVALVCCLSILGAWIWMRSQSHVQSIGGIDPFYLTEALLPLPLVILDINGDAFDQPWVLVTIPAAPGACWLAGGVLAELFGLPLAIAALFVLVTLGIAINRTGRRKERSHLMPLVGFFSDDPLGAPAPVPALAVAG